MRLIGVSLSNANLYGASLSYSTFINGTLSWWRVCGPFSLSCLFLSECQLLQTKNMGEKNKQKKQLCICSCLLKINCRPLTVSKANRKSRLAFPSRVEAVWSHLDYQFRQDSKLRYVRIQEMQYAHRSILITWKILFLFPHLKKRSLETGCILIELHFYREKEQKMIFFIEKKTKSWSVFVL